MQDNFGFVPGQQYSRRRDIHHRFGGQEQGGIITPKNASVVFVITGDRGSEFGYHDRFRADGIMEYYGEGQRGDMEFVRGNRAILEHEAAGKALLLFEKRSGQLRFLGPMRYVGHRIERAQDLEGAMRNAIVFLLEKAKTV
ncbi:hypothetical protein [Paracoccus sediminicola]|uniref:hypothetical protein n=1 Tax=Paracoccus sediminicola TaxID=3017783 RepID=UPI0022F02268|nr:hypothetical protein [Paracoccus sediminicola]WBU57595.1 hypothetical protein PAF18_03935 [Paracoccus sediminicola]